MDFVVLSCSEAVADKLWSKHAVELSEVGEVLARSPVVRQGREGLYYVLGTTESGRYLLVVLRRLADGTGRIVTAREMDASERRLYRKR